MTLVALPLLALLAAAPPTSEVTTGRFRIVHTERATGAAHVLAAEIEGRRDEIQKLLGRDWDGVTEIRLGFGREEYEALALPGGAPPSWAVALAYPEANVMLVEAHSLVKGDGQETLRHELVHIALGRLGHDWPRWFHEGIAQQLIGERRYSLDRYTTLARAVARDRIFRFDDLARGFPDLPSDVEIAYAQSDAFVGFLLDRHDRRAIGDLVDGVGRGETFEIAFAKAFHTSLNLEERAFRQELPGRYPFWSVLVTGTTLWVLLSGLVVLGWARRRRTVKLLRAQQAAQEAAEDAAARILAAEQARLATEAELLAAAPADDSQEPSSDKPTIH